MARLTGYDKAWIEIKSNGNPTEYLTHDHLWAPDPTTKAPNGREHAGILNSGYLLGYIILKPTLSQMKDVLSKYLTTKCSGANVGSKGSSDRKTPAQ